MLGCRHISAERGVELASQSFGIVRGDDRFSLLAPVGALLVIGNALARAFVNSWAGLYPRGGSASIRGQQWTVQPHAPRHGTQLANRTGSRAMQPCVEAGDVVFAQHGGKVLLQRLGERDMRTGVVAAGRSHGAVDSDGGLVSPAMCAGSP